SGVWLTTWISSISVGPEMIVVVSPRLGVARAIPMAIPPTAQATRAPTNRDLDDFECLIPLANSPSLFFSNMISLLMVCVRMEKHRLERAGQAPQAVPRPAG